jgi:hypothetical protein
MPNFISVIFDPITKSIFTLSFTPFDADASTFWLNVFNGDSYSLPSGQGCWLGELRQLG